MLTFAISLVIMLVVVGASVQWAVRAERRNMEREADASDH
jgi:putative effector of murein hydrolase LrgA (UPF0299 family)